MNILKYYHENRIGIWITIIAIIIIIIAIQTINGIIKNNNGVKSNNLSNQNDIIKEQDYKNNLNPNILISDTEVVKEKQLIIDQFIRYCNTGKIQKAYDLLSDNCKKQLFPTLEIFKQNYYNINFQTTRLYSKEKFLEKTYKIKLYEDILSTGNANSKVIEDYYTIINKDDNVKINISNYINEINLDKSMSNNKLKVNIVKKQVYKEYEEYEINITNLTYNDILLDSQETTKSIYLTGNKNVQYYSLSHEMSTNDLVVKSKGTKTIFIKFNKEYNSNSTINSLNFTDIIENNEEYQKINKKSEYKNRSKFYMNF
ncbi:MAG: hypothetical protein GX682_03225 [Clostridiaceae bacterium]|nr:hypothetical protein [Clostridiaceae bacterium]